MMDYIEQSKNVTSVLATNRTENIGMDVWDDFVVPRYFDSFDFFSTMPCQIEGGRGCGKTMLLRYLSYQSQFSANRADVSDVDTSHIGLYWRADTQFLRQMDKRGQEEGFWEIAFEHYVNLKVVTEIFKSVEYISVNKGHIEGLDELQFESLDIYEKSLIGSFSHVKKQLERQKKKFEIAVSNPSLFSDFIFFPFGFIGTAIEEIQNFLPQISNSIFHVFIDECENLLPYQQVSINTKIKHSEPPIIFKIACKKNGMTMIETISDEAITKKHDYVVHDLDEYIASEYPIFAAEVLMSRINKANNEKFNLMLSNVEGLAARREENYIKRMLVFANNIIPGKKQSDFAADVFVKKTLFSKLVNTIEKALIAKGSNLSAYDFISEETKEASIVCTALLNRKNTNPNELKVKFEKYEETRTGPFKDWIATNFIGCYLNIIKRKQDENRLYSGFNTYIALSKGNLRHFLELCRTAFAAGYEYEEGQFLISSEVQSFASDQTSVSLFKEIKSFKPFGHTLHLFANRLGELFSLYQSRLSQSEPEINHFSIEGGETAVTGEYKNYLDECEKWGILSKTKATKTKAREIIDDFDWVFNPIYAPKFGISYRKKRKLILTHAEIQILFNPDKSKYEELFQRVRHSIGVDGDDVTRITAVQDTQQDLFNV
jgi:hypothetical protein